MNTRSFPHSLLPWSLIAMTLFVANPLSAETRTLEVNGVAITEFTPDPSIAGTVDFEHAQAMPLPTIDQLPGRNGSKEPPSLGEPGFSAGNPGDGRSNRETTIKSPLGDERLNQSDKMGPMEYGTKKMTFSTARADLYQLATNTAYPYRASGKLFFNEGETPSVCSASMIKRGVLLTAAHCVTDYGAESFFSDFQYVPGYRDGAAPFGIWRAHKIWVMTDYFVGQGCKSGVICKNDMAVILLATQRDPVYAGSSTGWYGYGWNGYGFAKKKTQVTQIGYPVCLDYGQLMERNDSQGVVGSASVKKNTLIGSLMCGGSSGGPWLVNFGMRPLLNDTSDGFAPDPNRVIGVTSWGYNDNALKVMGASPFTSDNIVPLVEAACTDTPVACQ